MPFAIALSLLVGVLGFAVARPAGLPEAVVAVPAALVAAATHLVPWPLARAELSALAPTVGFLAAVLVLAQLADAEGVFRYAGAATAVLSLDATVVLLTPVVFGAAAASGARARPYAYACTHLANSASLLLPVSNLTNLLAFAGRSCMPATPGRLPASSCGSAR